MSAEALLIAFNNGQFSNVVAIYNESGFSPLSHPHESKICAGAYFKLGDLELAKNMLSSLESPLGDSVEYLSLYGATCRRLGQLNEAEILFKRAIDIDGDNPSLKNNYANLLIDLSRFTEAEKILSKLLAINPNYEDARLNLNRLKFKLDSNTSPQNNSSEKSVPNSNLDFDPLELAFSDDEVKNYGRLKQSNPNPTSKNISDQIPDVDSNIVASEQLTLARKAVQENNFTLVFEICTSILKSLGANPVVYDCVADAYIAKQRFLQAELCTAHSILLGQDNLKAFINLATLSSLRGDLSLANFYLEKAASINPSHPSLDQLRSNFKEIADSGKTFDFKLDWTQKKLSKA